MWLNYGFYFYKIEVIFQSHFLWLNMKENLVQKNKQI